MIQRTLREVETMVEGYGLKKENADISIKGVCIDSRQIEAGQLFVPIIGERFNGHKFVKEAIKRGAVAAIWNKNEPIPNIEIPIILVDDTLTAIQQLAKSYRQQLNVEIIGITGSNGKTSTKDILASLLQTQYRTHKTFGNLNNHLGVPLTILELEENTEMGVIEMGMSNTGEIELLTSIASPDAAVITNIGEAHLEELKTKENIVKAKLEILKGLKSNGLFVYFGDDPLLDGKVKSIDIDYRKITFGHNFSNTYQPVIESVEENGILFRLKMHDCSSFFLPMLGKHQMYNATAAIAVARYFGISFENIQKGLLKVEATGMRNELIHTGRCTILNDSYKSNPTSVLAALDTLYSIKNYSQKIVILGDMNGLGAEEIKMHEEIGVNIDATEIDYLFTLGPLAGYIARAARTRFQENRVFSCTSKAQLIRKLKKIIKDQCIILVKGSRELRLEEIVDELSNKGTLRTKEVI